MSTTKTIADLATAIETAIGQWDGITWDTGPQDVLHQLTKLGELAAKREEDDHYTASQMRKAISAALEPDHGTFWSDDGSYQAQCLARDWRDLRAEIETLDEDSSAEDIETARQHAEWIVDAERKAVEANAEAARAHGEAALEAAEAGDWDTAVEELEQACQIEREYGDDPAWGPAYELAVELSPEA